MKITFVLIASLAFVFGGIPKDRIDPCAFFGICDGKTTSTKAPSTPKKIPNSNELGKLKTELVCLPFYTYNPNLFWF